MYRIIGADGREYGPVSRETWLQWIGEHRTIAQTSVQPSGATGWQSLGGLPEFASAFASEVTPPKPPVATCAPIAPFPVRRTNGLATASLVMGLLAITCGCCCCYGFPFNVLGLVFGLVALSQINRRPAAEAGRELAIIGIVLCVLSLAFSFLAGLFGMVAAWPDVSRHSRHWRV
jgi:hypothetical protein